MEKIMDRVLDVRDMVPKDRHERIFKTFEELGPGESFVLINDHEPKPLLYQFQSEHDGEFDWWPLEKGPEAWRVVIAKRKVADPKRTVTEYFQTDHARLDAIFRDFLNATRQGDWENARKSFLEFSLGLRRHIQAEEEILFPLFEEKTGMHDSGPTFVMRSEHERVKELLNDILENIDKKDAEGAEKRAGELTVALSDHNMKEEQILYPESDSFLSEAERVQVVKKAQAI